jgi:UDP-glucuronate decarboxylase
MTSTIPTKDRLAIAIELLESDARQALQDVSFGMLRGKKVLVTGASGFIGSHLLAGLLQMQQALEGNLAIYAAVHRRISPWLASMGSQGRVTFLSGDLSAPEFISTLPDADVIVHAATYGQPRIFSTAPDATLKLNTFSTFMLLDRLRAGGHFLFLSSSEVYGGLMGPPFTEDQIGTTNTTHPRACYIEGKRTGEAICIAYRRKGIDAKAVRLCHAYGPGTRNDDQRALNSFIETAIRENKISLLDAGLARRSYCYISDVGKMIWRILLSGKDPIYNVGGGYRTTIAELAKNVGAIMGVEVVLPQDNASTLPGASNEVSVSIARFEAEFGKFFHLNPEVGLERTVVWHRAISEIATNT